MLVVYVDDMKLSGPEHEIASAWKDLSANINLEVPKGDTEDTITFLGCESVREERTIRGHQVTGIKYNISGQLKKALAKYEAGVLRCTGKEVVYKKGVKTPFLPEKPSTQYIAPRQRQAILWNAHAAYTRSLRAS